MTDDLNKMQLEMHSLGMEQIALQKTLNHEVEQYELACLQGKDKAVLEDHYLRSSVTFERFMDKKRELAELARRWSLAQANRGG